MSGRNAFVRSSSRHIVGVRIAKYKMHASRSRVLNVSMARMNGSGHTFSPRHLNANPREANVNAKIRGLIGFFMPRIILCSNRIFSGIVIDVTSAHLLSLS